MIRQISIGFLDDNLLTMTAPEDGIAVRPSAACYARLLAYEIRESFPQAEVVVVHQPGGGVLPSPLKPAVDADTEEEEKHALATLDAAMSRVYDRGLWIVTEDEQQRG